MLAKAAQTAGLIFFRKPMGARGVFFVSKINFFQKSNIFFYVADIQNSVTYNFQSKPHILHTDFLTNTLKGTF